MMRMGLFGQVCAAAKPVANTASVATTKRRSSEMGAMVAEIFQGRDFGGIFGTVMLAALAGGAAGPWLTGVLHDAQGNYTGAFWVGAAMSVVSGLAIWRAAPGKVRAVAGRIPPG